MIIFLLVTIIVAGSVIISTRYRHSQTMEITLLPEPEFHGEIYIGGAVNVPGLYALRAGDSIDTLIQSAGGTTAEADLNGMKLYIPTIGEREMPQKVDINRAESWLLQAIPGIGEIKAQAIIDYRQRNGRFRHISEITEVEGIGTAIYQNIKHLITVSE